MALHEKFLYHIWDAGHLQPDLKTVSGKRLKINYQGQYNTNRGPDFSFAILELDAEPLQGCVEIHLKSSDWRAHSHDEDPYYNKVVLHVVLDHNQTEAYTIREDAEPVEILELRSQLSGDIAKLWEEHDSVGSRVLNQYCELLSAIDSDDLRSSLTVYGRLRFFSKVRRFNAMLSLSNFDQLLYEGMMEALGYDKNKLNMLYLAQALPLHQLKDWYHEGMSQNDMISIFLFNSGLWAKAANLLPPDLQEALAEAYERQPFSARKINVDWQLFRIRPAGHPIYRLIAMLKLLYKSLGLGFLTHILRQIEHPQAGNRERAASLSRLLGDEDCPLPKPGKAVCHNILLNIYLPILYLWYDKLAKKPEKDEVLESYTSFPGLQENHITRFMKHHVNPSQHKLIDTRAIYQQGLLELYHRHCNYHLCNECLKVWRDLKAL